MNYSRSQHTAKLQNRKYLEALKSCISSETKSTPEGAKYQNRSHQLEFVKMEGPCGFTWLEWWTVGDTGTLRPNLSSGSGLTENLWELRGNCKTTREKRTRERGKVNKVPVSNLPGNPGAETPRSRCRGPGSVTGRATHMPQARIHALQPRVCLPQVKTPVLQPRPQAAKQIRNRKRFTFKTNLDNKMSKQMTN